MGSQLNIDKRTIKLLGTHYKEVSIAQIGNGSMSLGTLSISLNLENDNSGLNVINEENLLNKKV